MDFAFLFLATLGLWVDLNLRDVYPYHFLLADAQVDITIHRVIDSLCRDSADTQYIIMISWNLKIHKWYAYKPLWQCILRLWVFSRPTTHQVMGKSIATDSLNIFLIFFRQASSKLWDYIHEFLHKTAAFYTEQCTSPLHLLQLWSLTTPVQTGYRRINYGFICNHWNLIITQDHWIRNTVMCMETESL